ncbi:Protein SHORT HYPOCOTYL IN WHITE LIGHT 1 [Linum grandiflorum]
MMLNLAAPLPTPSLSLRPAAAAANLPRRPPNLSCPLLPRRKTPPTVICHGKLDGLYGENPDPVEKGTEAFFESIMGGGLGIDHDDDDGLDDYDDEEEETESSIDLFIRFLQSSLKKVSRRAKRASRSVLPSVISPQLVFCTLGSTVFAAILLVRVVWAVLSYFQSNGNDGRRSSGTRQPVI